MFNVSWRLNLHKEDKGKEVGEERDDWVTLWGTAASYAVRRQPPENICYPLLFPVFPVSSSFFSKFVVKFHFFSRFIVIRRIFPYEEEK